MGAILRVRGLTLRSWIVASACLLLFLGNTAAAAPEREEVAVSRLLRPSAAGQIAKPSDTALAALLKVEPRLDPWLLVEHLLARDRQDVAIHLARLTAESWIGPLVAYAEATDAAEGSAERLRILKLAIAAFDAKDYDLARVHCKKLRAVTDRRSLFSILATIIDAENLDANDELGQAIETWILAAEGALQIGWWGGAHHHFWRALEVAYDTGSYELAARAAEGVRAVAELFGSVGKLATAEHNLGLIAARRGDLPRALRHFNEALRLNEALGLAEGIASARSQLSALLAQIGEFAAAMEEQRALREHYADRPHDASWAENEGNRFTIRWRLGDEKGAAEALAGALEVHRGLGDRAGEASVLGNVGHTHALGARWDEAIDAFRGSLALMKALGDTFNLAVAKLNLAYALKGRALLQLHEEALVEDVVERRALAKRTKAALREAHALLDDVLAVAEPAAAADMVCHARLTRAGLHLLEGRRKEAIALLTRTRDEALRLRAWRTQVEARTMLARALLEEGDWQGALREARATAEALGRSFAGLAEADLARARALTPDVFDVGVSAALASGSKGDLLWFLEAGRAAALLRGLGGRATALRAAVPEALEQRLAESSSKRLAAYVAYRSGPRTRSLGELRPLRKKYEEQRLAEQVVREELARAQAAVAGRLAPARLVSIGDVQARLRLTARPGLRQVFALFNFQNSEAVALLIERSGAREVRYPATDLAELRKALATLSAARQGDLDEAALASVKRLLIEPLKIPAGPTRLFVCPDRDLAYAPLSAILPDDWELVWEPSATTYDLLAERRLRRGRGVLGLGNPDYAAAADPRALARHGGAQLTALPGSQREIEAITGGDKKDHRLLGGAATERGLAQALVGTGAPRHWKSVHLACHGLIDVEWPAFSCLAVTPGDGEDGLLTASEILRLHLRTDLAVLSACRTGRGKFVRGEGVMSLTRAFMFAGAPRVIVSLWDVDDEATSYLMQVFYREWGAGRGTAEALRRAQLAVRDHKIEETIREAGKPPRKEMRRHWAHPRYWAAWSLWGLPN